MFFESTRFVPFGLWKNRIQMEFMMEITRGIGKDWWESFRERPIKWAKGILFLPIYNEGTIMNLHLISTLPNRVDSRWTDCTSSPEFAVYRNGLLDCYDIHPKLSYSWQLPQGADRNRLGMISSLVIITNRIWHLGVKEAEKELKPLRS